MVNHALQAITIHVPADSTTIQAGIDGASDGDTVLVADGTYTGAGNRDIDFLGKSIVLMWENGPEVTIIDCAATLEDPHRGVYFHSGESPSATLQGFTIKRAYHYSDPGSYGVGIYCHSSAPTIKNCIVTECVGGYGAGINCRNGGSPTVISCLIYGNTGSAGAGVDVYSSSPTLINCTITGNQTDSPFGGGFDMNGGSPVLVNCVIWGNTGPGVEDFSVQSGSPSVSYCDIGGGWSGVGNIDADPLFINPSSDDYHLQNNSPCVDAGDSTILDACLPPGLGEDWSDMGAYGGAENCIWFSAGEDYDLLMYPTGPDSVAIGETFDFRVIIHNNTENPVEGDFWLTVMLPDSSEFLCPSMLLNYENPLHGQIIPYGIVDFYNQLLIPQQATPGTAYCLIGRIGLYPSLVLDEDAVCFYVKP